MNGMANLHASQPEAAIDAFETSMQLDPHDRLGRRNNAGVAQPFCLRFDDAIPRLRMMVREFPRWATPYAALASYHAHLGFVADAEAVARQLKAVDPLLRPNALQFRNTQHQALMAAGMRFAGCARSRGPGPSPARRKLPGRVDRRASDRGLQPGLQPGPPTRASNRARP
jgi:hypothetical protein